MNELKQQMEIMNNKLERILNLVMAPGETEKIKMEEKVSTKPKTKKAKAKKKK